MFFCHPQENFTSHQSSEVPNPQIFVSLYVLTFSLSLSQLPSLLPCQIFLSKFDSSFTFSPFGFLRWKPFNLLHTRPLRFKAASQAVELWAVTLWSAGWTRVKWVISTFAFTNYTFCWWVDNMAMCTHTEFADSYWKFIAHAHHQWPCTNDDVHACTHTYTLFSV